MRRIVLGPVAAGMLLALAACGESKQDILDRAEGIETRQELRDSLGKPDDIAKAGPVERWTYEANDGAVTFIVVGDKVTFTVAGE